MSLSPQGPNPPHVEQPSSRPASDRRRHWCRWAAVVGYMGVLFAASAQSTLPALPGNPSDSLMHFVAYAVLGGLLVWAESAGQWRRVTLRSVVTATVIASAYGYSDECHQLFVPNRSYDVRDWMADTTGAMLAAGLAWAWSILLRGRDESHVV